jgi:tetratricopeptide (TPR) repeat protein
MHKKLVEAEYFFREGNYKKALTAINIVLKSDFKNSRANELLAYIYGNNDKFDLLIKHLEISCLSETCSEESLYYLGQSYFRVKKYKLAAECFQKSINKKGAYFEALHDLGIAKFELNELKESIGYLKEALVLRDDSYELHYSLARVYDDLYEYQSSLFHYEKSILLNPSFAEALTNKGVVHGLMKNYNQALECHIKAIKIRGNFTEAWHNKGVIHEALNQIDDALSSYREAVDTNPSFKISWYNMGVIFQNIGRTHDALTAYHKAVEIDPTYAAALNNLAHIYLHQFNFELGWQYYSWRWKTKTFDSKKLITLRPTYTGGKNHNRLFIWSEQGVGDQVLYSSVFKELEVYPQVITISLEQKLLPLYSRSFPRFKFISNLDEYSEDDYDEQISIADIVPFFRANIRDFKKVSSPYLTADKIKTRVFMETLKRPGKLLCGLSWRSANKIFGEGKSIPLENLKPLLSISNIDFVNLQYGNISIEMDQLEQQYRHSIQIIKDLDAKDDIDGLAALINACDLVITASNTTAHFAGALGKKTLLILPFAVGKFWYWHDIKNKSLWYPSVKVFHQSNVGSWSEPVLEVREYLAKLNDCEVGMM